MPRSHARIHFPTPTPTPTPTSHFLSRDFGSQQVLRAYVSQIKLARTLKAAEYIYKQAKYYYPDNVYILGSFLAKVRNNERISHSEKFALGEALYREAVKQKIINTVICNIFIGIAGECQRFRTAESVFHTAKRLGVDENTYTSFMKAAYKNKRYGQVKDIFYQISVNMLLSKKACVVAMHAAMQMNDFALADDVFVRAQGQDIFATYLYNIYISKWQTEKGSTLVIFTPLFLKLLLIN